MHFIIMHSFRVERGEVCVFSPCLTFLAYWPTSERPHGLKYSLYYGRDGVRIVGYDNERGKGDHKHLGEVETRYKFVTVEKLVADFLTDVQKGDK